eukprot:GHRQ01002494.1.p1 GENE.GHRQ01002494.1~~GHRQ01002494.1.p1  ORF type:complete len:258 (+),score=77.66 GHRQ01002494.1:233-1006(+)
MPPRGVVDVGQAGGGVQNWWDSQPPITRTMAAACFLTTLGSYLGLINVWNIVIIRAKIIQEYQIWRLVTNHFFIGPFGMKFLFNMIWLLQYGSILEKQTYMFAPADMVFMLLFCGVLLSLMAVAFPFLGLFTCASALIFCLIYLYSRHFPTQQVSIMGLFQVQSFYLPFAFLGITVVLGGDPKPDICGIVVAHIYYWLTELYPTQAGRPSMLPTPQWLKVLVSNMGIGPPLRPADATPAGFSAFRGTGRRLGDVHED